MTATSGQRIRELRVRRGLTRRGLEDASGISQRQIAYLEDDTKEPKRETLRALALALETTADYLLGLSDDPAVPESDWPTRAFSKGDSQTRAA
jgi:repressor LexA